MHNDKSRTPRFGVVSTVYGIAFAAALQLGFILTMRSHEPPIQTSIAFVVGTVMASCVTLRNSTVKETIAWAAVGWIGSFLITVSLPLGYFSTHPAVENAVVAVMQASLGFPMIALLNFMGATIAEKLISRKYSSREDT